ncbi:uncharacterized protein LOC110463624 [Mizuhopecten yessoensis]|uniref:THD domain-containing protein n=1 Tax=Mizuhopecten yessoensis TaxID=6573 RepID=A0A210PVP4_MIZYE|nr:uncharacterized protein LOC110463624 [Mizuhopecten yessoensis]OWF40532.1 hypothetical protein KP79_PYT19970 [Mizuhopecten yessoensis]
MECKVQKHPVIVFDKEGGSSTGDGNCTSCSRCGLKFVSWTNLTLLFVLFLSNIFLHYKCMTISNELSELQQSQKRGVPAQASYLTSSVQDLASDSKPHNNEKTLSRRNNRQVRRRRREILNLLERNTEKNRDAIERILSRPAIHLRGSTTNGFVQNAIFTEFERTNIFRWEHQDRNYPNPSFRYVNDMQDSNMILGVNITNPGMYLIYSQVVVRGPFTNYDPAYGLETVRKKPGLPSNVLLRSYVTQDGRGSAYPNIAHYPGTRYPVDFINHMGMFELDCDDIIYVKIPDQSSNGVYPRIPEQTYFGLELIKPKYSYLERLNGC